MAAPAAQNCTCSRKKQLVFSKTAGRPIPLQVHACIFLVSVAQNVDTIANHSLFCDRVAANLAWFGPTTGKVFAHQFRPCCLRRDPGPMQQFDTFPGGELTHGRHDCRSIQDLPERGESLEQHCFDDRKQHVRARGAKWGRQEYADADDRDATRPGFSGSIQVDGLDVLAQKNEVRKVLGYLPQEFGVYPKISALDLLQHLAVMKGIASARERKEAVEALLQQTNLWEVRKKALGTFSGGMKQRFGIAQALLGNPRLIIVDEPTAGSCATSLIVTFAAAVERFVTNRRWPWSSGSLMSGIKKAARLCIRWLIISARIK
jgi:energy-coupling factor transporter ATP-binding protein EcfA2